jgi:hypothetical protein
MMLYVLIPHSAPSWESFRLFTTYAAVEQAALRAAQGFERTGFDPDWCSIIAYEGQDELDPIFLYTLVGSTHLHRERYPTPSS